MITNKQALFQARILAIICFCLLTFLQAQNNQKRDRGESFYDCLTSNTSGPGDIWVSVSGVGSIWDDSKASIKPDTLQSGKGSSDNPNGKWVSNVRLFPEVRIHAGVFDFLSLSFESRVLGWGFKPGWVGGSAKFTWPNNQEIRLNGFGAEIKYKYQFVDAHPSLGGYIGCMPEGFVVKGNLLESKFLYELEVLARATNLPLRLLLNAGIRMPLQKDKLDLSQFLTDAGIVYSGYGFDFYLLYSLEAFNNFFGPKKIERNDNKKYLVFFSENPMYATIGGNIRYNNGVKLSLSIPLLLSVNKESKMYWKDMQELYHNSNPELFPEEKKLGIKDPFDPWFVKWKIVGTLTFPLHFKMTSTELMRNFLLLKNRKMKKQMDIDRQIQERNVNKQKEKAEQDDSKKRLEEIKKRKDDIDSQK